MKKNYWLMKTEKECYSIDDLKRDGVISWDGVRNYQARNYMRDMKAGDMVLFYHSSSDPSGVAGIGRIARAAHPDATALDPKEKHYDPKATKDKPIWLVVDVEFVRKFAETIPLARIKIDPALDGILVAQKGSRLSIMPVSEKHFKVIERIGK